MIFTIGYERLQPARLKEIAYGIDALVIDVRHVPRSRKPGWSMSRLLETLGHDGYTTMGNVLGGRGHTSSAGINTLDGLSCARDVILLCLEEAPGHCHRHHDICGPHFPRAIHIYQDELLRAGDLSEAIRTEGYYDQIGSLAELIENPNKARQLLA
jgi:uncharacterized protein (DUF488 family)